MKGGHVAGLDELLQQILGGSTSAGGLDISKLAALVGPLLQQLQAGGGLQDLLGKLQQAGMGGQVDSWLGQGANEAVNPQQLGEVLGAGQVDELAQQSGMTPAEVQNGLSEILPGLVNQLSPSGSLPTNPQDLSSMLNQIPGGDSLSGMLGGLLGGGQQR